MPMRQSRTSRLGTHVQRQTDFGRRTEADSRNLLAALSMRESKAAQCSSTSQPLPRQTTPFNHKSNRIHTHLGTCIKRRRLKANKPPDMGLGIPNDDHTDVDQSENTGQPGLQADWKAASLHYIRNRQLVWWQAAIASPLPDPIRPRTKAASFSVGMQPAAYAPGRLVLWKTVLMVPSARVSTDEMHAAGGLCNTGVIRISAGALLPGCLRQHQPPGLTSKASGNRRRCQPDSSPAARSSA